MQNETEFQCGAFMMSSLWMLWGDVMSCANYDMDSLQQQLWALLPASDFQQSCAPSLTLVLSTPSPVTECQEISFIFLEKSINMLKDSSSCSTSASFKQL